MIKKHNSIVLKLANRLKKHKLIYILLKRMYYYVCYIFLISKNNRYDIKENITLQSVANIDGNYFFGYHHNTPWSYDDRFILINSIIDSKNLQINLIDLYTSEIREIDQTTLWNFQQGPMLGWFPGKHTIYYNKFVNNSYKTILYDIINDNQKIFNLPIQAIHPTGDYYLSINYQNMSIINKDYGYNEKCSFFSKQDMVGIWKCSFNDDICPELIISLDDVRISMDSSKDELNHCLFSDNGNYFLFIYRYKKNRVSYSKLILANTKLDSSMIEINKDFVSHMCWIDDQNIFYFGDTKNDNESRGYYIYNIINSNSKKVMSSNDNDGHPSINKTKEWIILDTYPDRQCNCHLYLYNIISEEVINIGKFRTNVKHQGYYRCDLHPRWNNKGNQIMVDTLYRNKRSSFILDLEKIINGK